MKKLLVLLTLVLCVTLVGCNKKVEWIKNNNLESVLDVESKEIFNNALNDSDLKLEPITLLATQVVEGTNYMYLALEENSKGSKDYKIVIVYKNLEGTSTITKTVDFDLEKYLEKEIDTNTEVLVGGWNVNENVETLKDEDLLNVFNKSTETLMGANYKPIILLATKDENGNNYAILSLKTLVIENPISSLAVLTINKDNDNIKLKTIANVDLNEYNK